MNFDMMQITFIVIYSISTGFCVGGICGFEIKDCYEKHSDFWKEMLIAFIPLVNTGVTICIVIMLIVDKFELYIKNKNDESDSIEW